ncbi:MAG: RHS repeat-associated core domain-containing protein [Candidatus Omnitrophota bacterium]
MGRFISADPSGMTDGPNLYVYCKNDPVNAVDLWGMCKTSNSKLGVYREPGNLAIYADYLVVYLKTDMRWIENLTNVFKNNYGILTTISTGELWSGSSRIIVYGAKENMQPTSWVVQTWQVINHAPSTRWAIYNWKDVPESQTVNLPIVKKTEDYFESRK